MLDAFRFRDFRNLWIGLTVSNIGSWMQIFALGILVVQIAERDGAPELAPLYLGLTGLARAVPGVALTLIAGAVADRVDRRRILFFTQSTMALNAAVLAVLVYLGVANLASVLIAAVVQSAAFAFDNPSRQSMIPRIVPIAILPSAIGLQSAAMNGSSVIGPLIAGVLYLPIGISGLLAANAISFGAILLALATMPAIPPLGRATASVLSSVAEGARYLRAEPLRVWILVISGTVFVTAGPASALLPAIAGEKLISGMSWLSLLLTAMGGGAFIGAFTVMNVGRFRSLGRVFVYAGMLNGAALVTFALTAQPLAAMAFAFITGFGGTLMAGMGNNMLQANTADAYRGRVMSVWSFTFVGLMPMGQLALGALGSLLGIHAALAVGGAMTFGACAYAMFRVKAVRDWKTPRRKHAPATPATVVVGAPNLR